MKPGVMEIRVNPKGIVSCENRGFADMDEQRPIQMDSVLWMASSGKTITVIGLMMLVEQGKISLDDPVKNYLPYFANLYRKEVQEDGAEKILPVKTPVTIRHLLSHTAGLDWLPGFFQYQELSYISLETQSHVYAASPLLFEPGTRWSYSNAGINVGGRLIEILSGMTYEEYMAEKLFKPLGMKDTTYHLTTEQESRRIPGYSYDPEKKCWNKHEKIGQMLLLPYDGENRHAECGGGLFSTPQDMARLAQMIANRGELDGVRYLSPDSLREICKRQTAEDIEKAYGLGSSVDRVGHGGAWGTNMQVDLDTQEGTLIMRQKAGTWPEDLEAKAE